MRSHWTIRLRVTNPIWWAWTYRARRIAAAAEVERQERLASFHRYLLEPEYVEYRYGSSRAREQAPLAPYCWFRDVKKEITVLMPEMVVRGT